MAVARVLQHRELMLMTASFHARKYIPYTKLVSTSVRRGIPSQSFNDLSNDLSVASSTQEMKLLPLTRLGE